MKAPPPAQRGGRFVLLAAMVVGLAGCGQLQEGALAPRSTIAESQIDLFYIALITAGVVFVIVMGLWIWAMFRPRSGDGHLPDFPGTKFVAIGGLAFPSLVLIAMMIVTFGFLAQEKTDGDMTIRVTGHQFWWEIHYPEAETAITANELHIPVDTDVEIILESNDVIHSLWVPELGGKKDLIPGRTNRMILRSDETGVFRGRCAEYCGLQHARMDFLVFVQEQQEFDDWLSGIAEPAVVEDAAAQRLFEEHSCAACHRIRGTDADGQLGPDLTHFGSRETLGAALVPNTDGHRRGWIVDSQSLKPGNRMPPITTLDAEELAILSEYLESLK